MSDQKTATAEYTLTLSEAEKDLILDMLEVSLGDTRVEVHHTRTPDYHDRLLDREALLKEPDHPIPSHELKPQEPPALRDISSSSALFPARSDLEAFLPSLPDAGSLSKNANVP